MQCEAASLQAYRDSLSHLARLDREEEQRLGSRWRKGDIVAGEKIVEACLPFVMAIAVEYRRWGVPLEDIVQQGNVGLLRAAAKFDPRKDCRLATYASYWIPAEIRDYVIRAFRVVRIGTTKAERRALRAYRTKHISDPEQLSRISGLAAHRVVALLPVFAARESSLDSRTVERSVREAMASGGLTPEDHVAAEEWQKKASALVRDAIATLPERERFIVRERLMKDDPLTLEQIGAQLGVSKERVRQLEARARGKLRVQLQPLRETA